MPRPQTKNLLEYHERLQSLRGRAAVRPDVLIESSFQVPKDETGEPLPFKLNYAQRYFYNIYQEEKRSGKPIRLWMLKTRRVGLTSLFSAILTSNTWSMDNRQGAILAHNEDRAKRILQMCKYYYRRMPQFMQLPLDKDATYGLKYAQHDSELRIGVCSKPEKVRGDGLHEALLSEGAFYGNYFTKALTEISTTIAPAPGTFIGIDSTGRARGSQAHKHWEASRKGQTVYRAEFLSWIDDPTAVIYFEDDKHKDTIMGNMLEVEPRLVEKNKYWKLSPEQCYWAYWQYLYRCEQNFEYFCRDFAYDEEEAWTSDGTSFFGENEISALRYDDNYQCFGFNGRFINRFFGSFAELEKIEKLNDDDRSEPYIKVWKAPVPGRPYVIGADSSLGEANSTFTAGYVIDTITREMMCMYHGRIRPDEHAFIMASLGKMYNDALLAPEINPGGGGMSVLTDLQRLGYYRIYQWRRRDVMEGMRLQNALGWTTNSWSRPLILSELRKMVQDAAKGRFNDPGLFRDKACISEMRCFHVNPENGRPEAALDSFDDRIIGLAIAHRVAGDETLGGAIDLYMEYNKPEPSHPLIELANRLEERNNSEDAAAAVNQLLKYRDFELDENGQVQWYGE